MNRTDDTIYEPYVNHTVCPAFHARLRRPPISANLSAMSYKKEARQKHREELKRSRLPGIIAFIIAVLALLAFIILNREMASPFPRNLTNSIPATGKPAQ
jgi:hypothetical protein